MGSRLTVIALVAATSGVACAAPTEATVVKGANFVTEAESTMKAEGLIFAPYEAPAWLGAEETQAHLRCIGAVNRAVYGVLSKHYQVQPPPPTPPSAAYPRWMRAPYGPRVAVHVGSLRCGKVSAEDTFTLTPIPTNLPPGPPLPKPPPALTSDLPPGEVILEVIDRRSGAVVIELRGRADGDDPAEAAAEAATAAVGALVGF